MKPGDVLSRGRDAFFDGRYEDALRDFVWFHEHALEHQPSQYGVRLSFALGYWMELAQVYPAALEELEAVRMRGVSALRTGRGDRDLFHDVASIHREMGRTRETYELFRALKADYPDLAKECRHLAVEAIVEASDFKLASECLPHPEHYLLWLSDRLSNDLGREDMPRRMAQMRRKAYVNNYCREVETALRILRGLRNTESAKAALEWAVALVQPKGARAMVCEQLAPRHPPMRWRGRTRSEGPRSS